MAGAGPAHLVGGPRGIMGLVDGASASARDICGDGMVLARRTAMRLWCLIQLSEWAGRRTGDALVGGDLCGTCESRRPSPVVVPVPFGGGRSLVRGISCADHRAGGHFSHSSTWQAMAGPNSFGLGGIRHGDSVHDRTVLVPRQLGHICHVRQILPEWHSIAPV